MSSPESQVPPVQTAPAETPPVPAPVADDARSLTSDFFARNPPPGFAPQQPPQPQPDPQQLPQPQPQAQQPSQPQVQQQPQQQTQQPQQPQPPDPSSFASRYGSEPARDPAPAQAEAAASVLDALPETLPVGADGKPDPRSGHRWAELRTAVKRYEKEVVPSLEAKARAAEAKAREEAEARERLAKEKEALEEKLGQVSLSESPRFREKYATQEGIIRDKLAQALVRFARMPADAASDRAARLMSVASDPQALSQAVEDLHPNVAGAVLYAAQEQASLDETRRQELLRWRENAVVDAAAGARAAAVRTVEERSALAREAFDFARGAGNPELADPARADAVAKEFEAFLFDAGERELAKAAAEGFTAPFLYARISELQAENEALRRRADGLRLAYSVPAAPWQSPAPTPPAPPVAPSPDEDPSAFLRRQAGSTVMGFLSGQPPSPPQ